MTRVAFVGVGLIGSSIAARTRQLQPELELVACDVSVPELGFTASYLPDAWHDAVHTADLVIVALPPRLLVERIAAIVDAVPAHATVVDVCSVKAPVHAAVAQARQRSRFVGAHPMMGSEKRGAENANPAWLDGATVALTTTPDTATDALRQVADFFTSLGARIVRRSPEAHDLEVAYTSHLPQLLASALAASVPADAELVGPALRDMTRIAESPFALWKDILALNAVPARKALVSVLEQLRAFATDEATLEQQFTVARAHRLGWPRAEQNKLSDRVRESATGAFAARVAQLRREGREVYSFNVGEPALPLDPAFRALIDAASANSSIQYTATQGTESLRTLVAALAKQVIGTPHSSDQVMVTVGAKQGLHLALSSLLSPGDEVLLPTPAWVSFAELIRLGGGVPVAVPSVPTADDLAAARTPRTRALLLNSPNNPTGHVFSASQLHQLRRFADSHQLWVLSDELYRCYSFEGPHESALRGYDSERSVWFDGLSKSHALTGLRMGWAVGPRALIAKMRALASQETSCPSSLAQHVAERVLETYPNGLPSLINATAARRKQLMKLADETSALLQHALWPQRGAGAFYAWLDVTPFLGGKSSVHFCDELLDATGVALMHGEAFGAKGHVRMAYATHESTLVTGWQRFSEHLQVKR